MPTDESTTPSHILAWAADSGYTERTDGWYDEDGQGPYEISDQFVIAMEAAAEVDSLRPIPGAIRIAMERQRQIDQEGWTPAHDDGHIHGELAAAAISYAMYADPDGAGENAVDFWPWERSWWKPSDDPIRNLEKAGALIAAEIDRLQRTAS